MYTTKPPYPSVLELDSPFSQGLAGLWLMNEGSGLKAYDISGQGNHGTFTNMDEADWVAEGLDFDGELDTVNFSKSSVLAIGGDISLVVRMNSATSYPDTASYCGVVTHSADVEEPDAGSNFLYAFDIKDSDSTGLMFWEYGTGSNELGATSNGALPRGEPAVIAITRKVSATSTVDWYINGSHNVTRSGLNNPSGGQDGTLSFGAPEKRTAHSEEYAGTISHVQIYNRALSADEIASLYQDPYQMVWEPSETFYSFAANPTTSSSTKVIYYPYNTPLLKRNVRNLRCGNSSLR